MAALYSLVTHTFCNPLFPTAAAALATEGTKANRAGFELGIVIGELGNAVSAVSAGTSARRDRRRVSCPGPSRRAGEEHHHTPVPDAARGFTLDGSKLDG